MVRPRTVRENACLCFTLLSKPPLQKPWAPDPSRSVILGPQDLSEWDMSSVVDPKYLAPEFSFNEDTSFQCLPVPRSDTPRWMCRKVPKVSSFRSFEGIRTWCRKPQALTFHVCAAVIAQSGLVIGLPPLGCSYFLMVFTFSRFFSRFCDFSRNFKPRKQKLGKKLKMGECSLRKNSPKCLTGAEI